MKTCVHFTDQELEQEEQRARALKRSAASTGRSGHEVGYWDGYAKAISNQRLGILIDEHGWTEPMFSRGQGCRYENSLETP